MKDALFVLAMFLCLPGGARAADWVAFRDYDGAGVSSCPMPAGGESPFFCLFLTCAAPGAPLEWIVRYEGTALGEGALPMTLSVDHGPGQRIGLHKRDEGTGVQVYAAPFDRKAEGLLLARLAKGLRARLTLGEGAGAVTHALGLRGSNAAISQLGTLCPDPLAQAAPAPGAAPVPYRAQPPGEPAPYDLGAAEVQARLIDRPLRWRNGGGESRMLFRGDGTLVGSTALNGSETALSGSWQLGADGQLCWTTHAAGCFRFRQTPAGLRVLRSDGGRVLDLGAVTLDPM